MLARAADWCCETGAWYYRHSANLATAIGNAAVDGVTWCVGRWGHNVLDKNAR